ncbi:PREDICTED: transcription factor bHLH101-like [Nelumbo nucifera]|uniref:BHLH domain-containing protein n=2 Tax=Nelumbo nucifera TaxID=4432 RepID=A0A822Z8B2_NELNU|nr:PREDICTED: transcription factor bHLH101-like [Nelumbo nucifera]DAD39715.1 TPA_asm: hypothetical protein HUJ06_014038 [Nelumbo nucifera]
MLPIAHSHHSDGEKSMLVPAAETSEDPWLPFEDDMFTGQVGSSSFLHQEDLIMVQPSLDEGLVAGSNNQNNKERAGRMRSFQTGKSSVVQPGADEESIIKKLDHNAKEKLRRVNLNASYLALRTLLPDSSRSKKKWSAPVILGKVVEYIPELKAEIKNLTRSKEQILSTVEKKQMPTHDSPSESKIPTVSITEVRKGELIVQICMKRENSSVLSTLLANAEGEGMQIVSTSSLSVPDDRDCYHLHLHVNGSSPIADYIAVLRAKLLSWLCGISSILDDRYV